VAARRPLQAHGAGDASAEKHNLHSQLHPWRHGGYVSADAWTEAEVVLLVEIYPDVLTSDLAALLGRTPGSVHQAAAKRKIFKTREFLQAELANRNDFLRNAAATRHRFLPGGIPWNKDTKGIMPKPRPGLGFQPGGTPHTWKPIGSEKFDKDGHKLRKVSDTRVRKTDWQPLKDIAWRGCFGEIPPGLFVICKDRNPDNLNPDNLELVTRAENMRRNSYHNLGPELAQLYQIKGQINRQLTRIIQRTK
jgi:hypothetical protein